MSARIITGLLLAIVAVPIFFIGDWWYVSLILVALIIATTEFLSAAKVSRVYWLIYFFTYLAITSLTFWVFIKNNMKTNVAEGHPLLDLSVWSLPRGFNELDISTLGIVVIMISLFTLLIFDRNFQFEIATYMFMMIVLVGIGFQSFLFLRFYPLTTRPYERKLPAQLVDEQFLTTLYFDWDNRKRYWRLLYWRFIW